MGSKSMDGSRSPRATCTGSDRRIVHVYHGYYGYSIAIGLRSDHLAGESIALAPLVTAFQLAGDSLPHRTRIQGELGAYCQYKRTCENRGRKTIKYSTFRVKLFGIYL